MPAATKPESGEDLTMRAGRIIENDALRQEVLRRLCWTYADDVYQAMHDREERMAAIKDGTYGKKYRIDTLG